MRLYFTVPDTPQTQNGVLLRNFLRQCAVSTDLARAVKFRGSGFLRMESLSLPTAGCTRGRRSALSCRRKGTAWPRSRRSR
ncbi:MAG: hypothetical protein ACLS34_02390 [Faecalibacterium sp.]